MNGDLLLTLLRARHSVREFTGRPVPRALLERLVEAATTAPSPTNRQPWRFAVVTAPALRARFTEIVRARVEEMAAIFARSPHGSDVAGYWEYFWRPLASAQAIVVPQYRTYPDTLASLLESGGADPKQFVTADAMHGELSAASAAVMALLLQAQAEGLGGCWMTGPLVAREQLAPLLGIAAPWRMLGALALGYPAAGAQPTPRKPLSQVIQWFEETPEHP